MKGDFSQGKVWKNIISQSLPLMLAQLVQILYNVIDRVYIGHLDGAGSMALTGIGLVFPITTLIAAFTNLFSMGGAPLFSIARGAGEDKRAERILGQVVSMLVLSSVIICVISYTFRKQILFLFGAGDESYVYADDYLKIYLLGTVFSMLSTGLNGFINAQGYPSAGMAGIIIGAVMNIVLDPIFIFSFGMGVKGAALATVISQLASAVWVMVFFAVKSPCRIRKENLLPDMTLLREITGLGLSGFIMQGTNCLVQVVCNSTLKLFGGELYVGIMTVLNSVREILSLPVHSISGGAQPVLSYNYGAEKYKRLRSGICFTAAIGAAYTVIAWIIVIVMPQQLMEVFTDDAKMILLGSEALQLYFFGFLMMSFQFAGQSVFTALGYAKHAIFFSLLRKAVIVVPLTLMLPRMGFGTDGVFLAEPISNALGGIACFLTMWLTIFRRLPKEDKPTQCREASSSEVS